MKTNYELRIAFAFLLSIVFCLLSITSFSQSNLRIKIISLSKDTTQLDSLSIIPGTVSLKDSNGAIIDSSKYKIDYVNALLIRKGKFSDTINISYKVFPFLFSKKFQHKDISKIQNNQFGEPYIYSYDKKNDVDFFKTEGLTKSGSISRGLSFGNNQDVVLNSNLNLQLAGKLSENIDILMAATDQNIPIQPEGNTQQLQEFDKVFIQLGIKDLPAKGKTTVTAGDFQIGKPKGYFMNFNKKLQGLSFETKYSPTQSLLTVKASAAISKGKFARNISAESSNGNTFNGTKQERNQGPYKLRGAENEQFIIVLAGTEKVFLDGRLLERGQENDYTINYNTSEIIFTPKNLITKDKRIVVEFQYSDKNYARSLIHAGTEYESKKVSARINIYNEQDNKNKPLQQELTDPQKKLLAGIGDSLQYAIWPSADSIAFNGTEVLYHKEDTTIGTHFYPGIFVYSTDSTKAHYRLSFSFVGANKGNYNLKQSAANGKVYEWILPDTITGQLKGSYEPEILLIAPKQKQMITAGADFLIGKNSKLSLEGAASNNNINTFSNLDKANDKGFAGKMNWDMAVPIFHSSDSTRSDTAKGKYSRWNLLTNINYEFVQKTFSPIERFRSVEFERDWNLNNLTAKDDQHIIGGSIGVAKKENIIAYDYKSFLQGDVYNGAKHSARTNLGYKGLLFTFDGSYLDSKSFVNRTNYLRSKSSLSQKIKNFTLGIREQQEQNLIKSKNVDSLVAGTLQYYEWEPFAEFRDSSNNKYTINYKQRTDYALKNIGVTGFPSLQKATFAENYGGGIELFSNPNSQFRITGSYRKLTILDTNITSQKPENTVVGRAEYNFSLLKGFFSSNTFYEIGSGLELKKEFIFLEVAPGKGIYVWKDYNGDGVKQLNEFEISPFPNEANYIKVWTPTDDYISAFTNQFSEVFTVKPAAKWSDKKGVQKFISRFSNQTAYRTDRKTTNKDLSVAYNPFLSDTKDNTLITLNSSMRNTVYFNQTAPVFGMDYTVQDVRNKTLLENDTSSRQNLYSETHLRWNVNQQWTFQSSYKEGTKKNNSKFFTARNYRIFYYETEPKISFQPNASFRVSVSYKYSEKKNTLVIGTNPQAKTTAQNFGSEIKYNALNKGSLTAKANFILIAYNDAENTPLAFEMLEGLKTGKNYTWSVGYSRTLANNIQLTLSYDGRQSPGVKTIHTGNAQVRAFF
ncbi:MAG: hypothetical protein HY063_03010 [Bacteroidetes bacterium]|nr:hypothetical protein [Bacteroidota bacterium]